MNRSSINLKVLPFIFFFWTPVSVIIAQDAVNANIHLDQFGYLPEMTKVAVLADPQEGFNSSESFYPSSEIQVINTATNEVVYTGEASVWNNGDVHAQSGDIGWWFDFSEVEEPGSYKLYDPENGYSHEFEIKEDVYAQVMSASTRMFYYNRANAPKSSEYAGDNWTDDTNLMGALQDGECRSILDQSNSELEKDLSGGWFDAGDYNKYVTFAESAVHNLLWAYQENPDSFTDDTGIPESGNGIPDILDEVKWELDWLLKMINSDGSTHIKMGFSGDYAESYSPPSSVTFPRFYGPTCTSASAVASGVLAHAAEVYGELASFTDYANLLQSQAELTFNYTLPFIESGSLELNCDDGSIQSGDADRSAEDQIESAVIAAVHLLALTEDNTYSNFLTEHIYDMEPLSSPFWGAYKISLEDALLYYSTLSSSDPIIAQDIKDIFQLDAGNNYSGFFGFSHADLYRAFMPDWSYHWGSNSPKAGYGVLNTLIDTYGILQNNAGVYQLKAAEQLHYFHGVNPLGMVMLSNMYSLGAEKSVNEIYHGWFDDGTPWDNSLTSLYGPPPGFLTGGPNSQFTVANIAPPAGQPVQKSYLDYNTNWPENSWEISEPAIYYQAIYIRLLANFTVNSVIIDNIPTLEKEAFHIYPNPSGGIFYVEFKIPGVSYSIENMEGKTVLNGVSKSLAERIDLSHVPNGIYLLTAGNKRGRIVLN